MSRSTNKMLHVEAFHDETWTKEMMSGIIKNIEANVSDVKYELSLHRNNYISITYNLCVRFADKAGKSVTIPMIIKKCKDDMDENADMIKMIHKCDKQFYNEILIYRMYTQSKDFPKYYYLKQSPGAIIALENMNAKGYYTCSFTQDVPLEYTLAAMRELGKFHAKGYIMKEQQRSQFFDIVDQLQTIRWTRTEPSTFQPWCDILATYGIEYLRTQVGYDADFCDKMETLLANAYNNVMLPLLQPVEPLSTLCHGDFMLDNVLFREQGDGNYQAMLIDFAHAIYATPVIDLSAHLCIYCSNDVRKNKFSDIMRAYHDTLKECLQDAGIWNDEKYSYDVFLDNYKSGALYGFVIASFFMIFLRGFRTLDVNMIKVMPLPEYVKLCKPSVNDELSKTVADLLLQLKDLGCLTNFL